MSVAHDPRTNAAKAMDDLDRAVQAVIAERTGQALAPVAGPAIPEPPRSVKRGRGGPHYQKDRMRGPRPPERPANAGPAWPEGAVLPRGVYWDQQKNAYAARITINGVARRLGRFEDPMLAARAYDAAAKLAHGRTAKLNFLPEAPAKESVLESRLKEPTLAPSAPAPKPSAPKVVPPTRPVARSVPNSFTFQIPGNEADAFDELLAKTSEQTGIFNRSEIVRRALALGMPMLLHGEPAASNGTNGATPPAAPPLPTEVLTLMAQFVTLMIAAHQMPQVASALAPTIEQTLAALTAHASAISDYLTQTRG